VRAVTTDRDNRAVTWTRPRLVATDLDGTIVPKSGEISDRTVRALQRVETAGVPVVFVTGRPTRWMHAIAERTGHTGLAVCSNGAVVYDLPTEQVVEQFPIPVDVGLDVARRLRAALPDVTFAVELVGGFSHEPAYLSREPARALRVAGVEDIYDAPAVKLLARHEVLDADELLAAARDVLGDVVEPTHSSTSGLLEISAAGVSKATTLAHLCDERGIDARDVLAFGDMPNDLPLLAWAGTAYAVANAHLEVLDAVALHCPSVDDDGVAQVLESVFGVGAS
jgi:Cof subfamily protein (haloacid dehalogenase superfamily)